MHKGGKRSEVTPKLRREWLRLYEEDGKSVAEIAETKNWDVRTIRKHLGLARQDREVKEANVGVFRQAIQDHHRDICSFCKRLDSRLAEGFKHISFSETDARMCRALRQHLPRSHIWRGLDKWEELVTLLESSVPQLREIITEKVKGRILQELVNSGVKPGQTEGPIQALVSHFYALAMGLSGLQDVPYIHTPKKNNNKEIEVQHGRFNWVVPPQIVDRIEQNCEDMKTEGLEWREYQNLRSCSQNLLELQHDLREELATIELRRVVPGRCVYCPIRNWAL